MELRKINRVLKKVGIVLVVEFDCRSERELIQELPSPTGAKYVKDSRKPTKLYFQKWSTYQQKAKRKTQHKKAVSK